MCLGTHRLVLASMLLMALASGTFGQTGQTYEVTMMYISKSTPKDLQLVLDEINKITSQKIGATLKLLPIGAAEYGQKVNLSLATSEKIDLLFSGNYFGMPNQIAGNKLLPMNDLLAKYGTGITGVVPRGYLAVGRVNGQQYGLPAVRDLAASKSLMMRKDLVEKYKINVAKIKNLDDVEKVLKVIKTNEPNIVPLVTSNGVTFVESIRNTDPLGGFGASLLNNGEDLKVVNWYDSDEYKKFVTRIHRWYNEGYLLPDAATTRESYYSMIRSGRGFGYLFSSRPGFLEQENRNTGREMVEVILSPAVANTDVAANMLWVMPRGGKNPEKSMQLLNLLYTDAKVSTLLIDGIEGKHYVKNTGGFIDFPAGIDEDTTGYLMSGWLFPNQTITPIWRGFAATYWKDLATFNNEASRSKAMGFTFDSNNLKKEVAAVSAVIAQYGRGLEYGVLDPETQLPEFLSKLQAAGIGSIVAEKQRQLNVWADSKGLR